MIQFHFLGGTVGFDVALRPGIVEFTFEMDYSYFQNQFIAKVPFAARREAWSGAHWSDGKYGGTDGEIRVGLYVNFKNSTSDLARSATGI